MSINKIKENFLNILDSLSDGIFISDHEGKALHVNKMYEQLTGIVGKDILGKNVRDLVRLGFFDSVVNPDVVRTHKTQTYVQQLKNGEKLILSGLPVFDAEGNLCLVVTFVRNITMISNLTEQVSEQKNLISYYHEQLSMISQQNDESANIIFSSEGSLKVKKYLDQVAKTDATILLLGQTGVGKDVFARYTHSQSNRKDNLFLKVDCGVISETLNESEMFGYVQGAFTGASNKGKAGYFELADKGTVFLDEVGELPLSMQTRLLRILQDGEIMRLGDTKVRNVDVRIIAATNRNLEECVEQGSFRSDLFYRLNVASVLIPTLAERKDAIIPLVQHYLKIYSTKYHKNITFMDSTLDLLQNYTWPGNIRQLQNMIHSLVITQDSPLIKPSDLPKQLYTQSIQEENFEEVTGSKGSLKDIMAIKEKEFLQKAIAYHGSVQKVAEVFQVNRSTIFRKLNS